MNTGEFAKEKWQFFLIPLRLPIMVCLSRNGPIKKVQNCFSVSSRLATSRNKKRRNSSNKKACTVSYEKRTNTGASLERKQGITYYSSLVGL